MSDKRYMFVDGPLSGQEVPDGGRNDCYRTPLPEPISLTALLGEVPTPTFARVFTYVEGARFNVGREVRTYYVPEAWKRETPEVERLAARILDWFEALALEVTREANP